jgi:hypothetical protein
MSTRRSNEADRITGTHTFQRPHSSRDAAGMVEAILELDRAIVGWTADTLESDDLDRAHSILRSLVGATNGRGVPGQGASKSSTRDAAWWLRH